MPRIPLREVFAERGLELVEHTNVTLTYAALAFDRGDYGEAMKYVSWARQHLRDAIEDMTGQSTRSLHANHEAKLRTRIETRRAGKV